MFSRNELIWGKDKQHALKDKHVVVFGVGAVGGYALEMLARCGVGKLSIIDFDEIDESKLKNMDSFIDLPRVDISIEDENKLLCGQKVCLKTDYEKFKLFCNDVLYGIASAKNGMIKVDTFLKEN